MIILGIDPGSLITGYGILQKQNGHIRHIDNGLIHCKSDPSFDRKLVRIFEGIQGLIKKFNPHVMAVENIFYSKNVMSTLKLGQARGSALLAAALLNIPIVEYAPMEVKEAVTGFGRATKDQVQKMVKTVLHLPQVAEENASDALAVGICHANSERMKKILSS